LKQTNYIIPSVALVVLLLSLTISAYAYLVLGLFFTILVVTVYKLGRAIVLRDLVALYSSFICLVMPLVGYEFYPKTNKLSNLFVKYMPIPFDDYFSFCLPAMAAFTLALCWPFHRKGMSDEGVAMESMIKGVRKLIGKQERGPLLLVIAGIAAFYVTPILPQALQFFFTLIYLSSFVGIVYIYLDPKFPKRKTILWAYIAFILFQALQQGMFTIVAYMGLTIFSFVFIGRKYSMITKLFVLSLCVFALIIVQSVKAVYRDYIWRGKAGGAENKVLLYSKLVQEKVSNSGDLFSMDAMFPIYMRTNQGFNIALVMRRFPRVTPYDNGANVFLSIASSFVPRLFWPDNPMAGGKFNMKYYTGVNIVGWSTNVGPLGEAYASFGRMGGILYMLFIGFFVRGVYVLVFTYSKNIPLLFLWIPVIFYQVSYSAENDTLQIFNSLLKSGIFVYILYRIWPSLFGVSKERKLSSAAKVSNLPALS
jgi:hypothetical protein